VASKVSEEQEDILKSIVSHLHLVPLQSDSRVCLVRKSTVTLPVTSKDVAISDACTKTECGFTTDINMNEVPVSSNSTAVLQPLQPAADVVNKIRLPVSAAALPVSSAPWKFKSIKRLAPSTTVREVPSFLPMFSSSAANTFSSQPAAVANTVTKPVLSTGQSVKNRPPLSLTLPEGIVTTSSSNVTSACPSVSAADIWRPSVVSSCTPTVDIDVEALKKLLADVGMNSSTMTSVDSSAAVVSLVDSNSKSTLSVSSSSTASAASVSTSTVDINVDALKKLLADIGVSRSKTASVASSVAVVSLVDSNSKSTLSVSSSSTASAASVSTSTVDINVDDLKKLLADIGVNRSKTASVASSVAVVSLVDSNSAVSVSCSSTASAASVSTSTVDINVDALKKLLADIDVNRSASAASSVAVVSLVDSNSAVSVSCSSTASAATALADLVVSMNAQSVVHEHVIQSSVSEVSKAINSNIPVLALTPRMAEFVRPQGALTAAFSREVSKARNCAIRAAAPSPSPSVAQPSKLPSSSGVVKVTSTTTTSSSAVPAAYAVASAPAVRVAEQPPSSSSSSSSSSGSSSSSSNSSSASSSQVSATSSSSSSTDASTSSSSTSVDESQRPPKLSGKVVSNQLDLNNNRLQPGT
jgi:uncharacterized protein YjiS (DUF1127 family)